MNNETIKNYQEITVEEAGEMLRDNGWKPVKGLAFKGDFDGSRWVERILEYIVPMSGKPFATDVSRAVHCAKVEEIDPCKAPDGCPELEPRMAYVGKGRLHRIHDGAPTPIYQAHGNGKQWLTSAAGTSALAHYAIDVRTEWAQEHFPEHCRIRNYQEPDAFEEWFEKYDFGKSISHSPYTKHLMRLAYELGRANAK